MFKFLFKHSMQIPYIMKSLRPTKKKSIAQVFTDSIHFPLIIVFDLFHFPLIIVFQFPCI